MSAADALPSTDASLLGDLAMQPRAEEPMDVSISDAPVADSTHISSDTSLSDPSEDFAIPDLHQESSATDNAPVAAEPSDALTSSKGLDAATNWGKKRLVDSDGYSYSVKRANGNITGSNCSVRNKTINCKATVRQEGELFTGCASASQSDSSRPGPNLHD